MANRKKRTKILIATAVTAAISVFSTMLLFHNEYRIAKAASRQVETVDLRIIGTTDIHGQLNSTDYELGVDYNNGGLARVFNLINQARKELPQENIITLDAGDVLYDYTTEYIFAENQNEVQPIYKAMAMIGYDAVTLGNHEFDYGYEYLLRQLNGSGLRNITVVSNLVDSKTGEYPFMENMLITRTIETSKGNEVEVTIGIIGQTIPTLTAKTHSYAGILKTEDMVENAKKQAAKLKEMGADVIVALSHTGIGPENPELNFKNVAYALTKIQDIDVVVCGHEHNLFPTTDMTSPYYQLPNVDKKTYLMNGKNVIMAGDRGRAIGVVDLTLDVSGEDVAIVKRKSELRFVTAENTAKNKTIASMYGSWEERLLEYSTDVIGELDKEQVIQNFFGLLGDNSAIQLLNDSKINYALRYVNTSGEDYKGYPIIAASTYASFGVNSINDYVNIQNQITESDLSLLQPYNNYLYLYRITGKQLKEWLEWSASAYETLAFSQKWTDTVMAGYMDKTKLKSLISEDWLNDWSSFYIFDGIEYEINPFAGARYDFSGNRISMNERITNITYNGEAVTDDMEFVLATDKITKPVGANSGVEKQVVLNGFNRGQAVLGNYLEFLSNSGSILPQVDYNWKVSFPKNYQFIVRAPYYAHDLLINTQWYEDYLGEANQYRYYIASYPVQSADTEGPHIVVSPVKTGITGSPFDVAVSAYDSSELKQLKYLRGNYGIDYSGWSVASTIKDGSFTVYENATYSILAEDFKGNKTIRQIVISNMSDELLGTPTVETYTNRKTSIKGTAEPGTTIVFETDTDTYEMTAPSSGKYSYPLPAQPSGSEVIIYVKNEKKGLESERITVPVKRTGPNQPKIATIYNNSGYITGNTNDSDASIITVVGKKVYVSDQGGRELYMNAEEVYDPGLEIVETSLDVFTTGYFIMRLPAIEAGTKVTIYNLDHLSRRSRPYTAIVEEAGPNAPVVYEVSNIERSIRGYVPTESNGKLTVILEINDRIYTTKTDKDGKFAFDFSEQLRAGQTLTVYAIDTKDGKSRNSYRTEVKVIDIEDYVRENSVVLTLRRVTIKSGYIIGDYTDKDMVYLAIANGEGESFSNTLYQVQPDKTGRITFELQEKLSEGTKIYVMSRFTDGRILIANMTEVLPGKPEMPMLVKNISNHDKEVYVIASKDCEVTLQIGSKTYTTSEYQYDEVNDCYIYTLATDRDVSGTAVKVTATNVTGTSDALTSKILKAAPDSPTINPIFEGDKIITGRIELLDYVAPAEDSLLSGETAGDAAAAEETKEEKDSSLEGKEEELPKKFKNAPSNVAKTQTSVYAQIGDKIYEGTIDNSGNFTIEIPEQIAGTAIKLWGSNKAGRGPLVKIVVVKPEGQTPDSNEAGE